MQQLQLTRLQASNNKQQACRHRHQCPLYSPNNRHLQSTTDDGGFSAGLRDGETRGFIDAKKGIDNNQCGPEHSNSYCTGYKIGYRLTLRPYL
jgi:hypothetical protein